MLLNDGIVLYHGSYSAVTVPDLSRCKRGKDFGQGFYVTTSRQQAVRFAKTSLRKAISNGEISPDQKTAYISSFEYHRSSDLSIFEFADADSEWLHCVVVHRRDRVFREEVRQWKEYDIICGKIANDNTNLVITAYMDGIYGNILSAEADRIAIGFLEPENLKDQICFRTEKSLGCLVHKAVEEIYI